MSKDLYANIALFQHHLDSCDKEFQALGFFQATPIESLPTLHAVFLAVHYTTAKCWMDCGLKVDAVIGHKAEQLTALCISGYLPL